MIDAVRSSLMAARPHHLPGLPDTVERKLLRWSKTAVWVIMGILTLQSMLLVAGAWRNDRQIERHLGVAEAEVLSAGPRRSTIEFVTPDRVTYRPELGVLYPSELAPGMRIYVEYDKTNPNLVRVQNRNATLAIVPAGSIAVGGWLIGAAVLAGLVRLDATMRNAVETRCSPEMFVRALLYRRCQEHNRFQGQGGPDNEPQTDFRSAC